MAKRVLMAEALIVGALGLMVLAKEMPGLVREIRIWRMAGIGPGSRRRR
ncbi:hypothetical protein [Streptomyces sp. HPF1205]|nr:hypothetical protein [Streptomyces sp. HPF1205]